jgi:hypothetical protein
MVGPSASPSGPQVARIYSRRPPAVAPIVCFLLLLAWLVGFSPRELVDESVTTWWFGHTTPADHNVSLGGALPE